LSSISPITTARIAVFWSTHKSPVFHFIVTLHTIIHMYHLIYQ